MSWRDAEQAEEAIESLVRARRKITGVGPRVSIVVVDNGSGLEGRGRVQAICPDATLIANPSNRGLAAASNQGARAASGDVLLFLNPDTRAEGDPFSEICRAFVDHPEAVAVAPRLFDLEEEPRSGTELAPPDREDQRTFQLRRLPSLSSDARYLLLLDHLLPNNPGRRRERYAEADREESFSVEQAAAAALAVRREAFERIGGFDERFFPAWFEDVDLCERLGALGEILYWPKARFRHRGRTSSEALGYARFLPIYYTNALRYRRRYTLPARWTYRALLAGGMLLRLAALPLRRRMPRPRRDAARAYLRTFGVAFGFTPPDSRLPTTDYRLPTSPMIDVSIIIVSHNDQEDLPLSVGSALAQRGVAAETIVVDNASSDGSRSVVEKMPGARLSALSENLGFAAAMNLGIEATSGRYVLALNPDCRLEADFAAILADRLDRDPSIGSASGRILRAAGGRLEPTDLLDSAGIRFTATGRHFDRGAGEPAAGRYLEEEDIAGTSGAAGFYRREALESGRISTGFFDSDFFLYREDADLAWRLRNLGWKCVYLPRAVAYHRRRNRPERRRQMSPLVNFHSVKNRFLLRINNQSTSAFWATAVPTLARDAVVLAACLTVERSSLPAFGWLWRNRRRLWAKRREIQDKIRSRRK